nr:hypothetical protein [Pseudomonas sp. BIGb0427]
MTGDGQAIALDTTFLLSRPDWPEVFIYNPDIGLQRFADRRQAKQTLLGLQDQPALMATVLRYAPQAQQQLLQRQPAVDFQVNLLAAPLFDSLMLTINDRLADQAAPCTPSKQRPRPPHCSNLPAPSATPAWMRNRCKPRSDNWPRSTRPCSPSARASAQSPGHCSSKNCPAFCTKPLPARHQRATGGPQYPGPVAARTDLAPRR